MRDFNVANNPLTNRSSNQAESSKTAKKNKSWKPEISLFSFLEDLDFLNIQKNWEELTLTSKQLSPTWKNKTISSRIDYI